MNRSTISIGFILVAEMSLSACGNKSEDDFSVPASRAESGRVEDQFGKGFGKAFRANPNSEPANVAQGDVIPVSRTAEPVDIN